MCLLVIHLSGFLLYFEIPLSGHSIRDPVGLTDGLPSSQEAYIHVYISRKQIHYEVVLIDLRSSPL